MCRQCRATNSESGSAVTFPARGDLGLDLVLARTDFGFPKQRVAVFVDECFWHGCPRCYTRPKTNRAFWDRKCTENMARDKRVNRQLRQQGWKVIRIWQLPSAVYATLRYQLVAKATYLRLRLGIG